MIRNFFTITICLACFACNTTTNNTENTNSDTATFADTAISTETGVPFLKAKNYFVKNTFKADSSAGFKITTQQDFDAVFGMASTMSAKGKPTPIDFSTQYVIGVIEPAMDKAITLSVESLTQKDSNIILNYTKTQEEKQSFTSKPFLLLIVSNKYTGNFTAHQQ